MKQKKKINPYEKKVARKKLRITRTHWIVGICILAVAATLVCFKLFYDPHAGHDHGSTDDHGHYEGDGHDHGTQNNTAQSTDKVKYQVYTNADNTFRLVFRDTAGKTVAEFNKVAVLKDRSIIREVVDETKGIYELGWPTGSGATEYECVYYNVKTGQVSQRFHAPLGTDGVRIAYSNEDETKVFVQELFNNKGYNKEHTLVDTYKYNDTIITGGKLQADNKTVLVSYYTDDKGNSRHVAIDLYE